MKGFLRLQLTAACALIAFSAQSLAQDVPKLQKIVVKAQKDIKAEGDKFMATGNKKDAEVAAQMLKAINDHVSPLSDPKQLDDLKSRLFASHINGSWDRPASPDIYVFQPGFVLAKGPTGKETNRGTVRIVSSESAEVVWQSGHIWTIYAAGSSRLAVDEKFGGDVLGDGLVLSRLR